MKGRGLVASGFVVAALGVGMVGTCIYKRGVPVQPLLVADFNKDGKKDVIYFLDPQPGNRLGFADGKAVRESGGRYFVPVSDFGDQTSIHWYKEYKPTAEDVDADGNLDFVMRPDPKLDPETKQNLGKRKIVYLGDGKGNFSRADEYSF